VSDSTPRLQCIGGQSDYTLDSSLLGANTLDSSVLGVNTLESSVLVVNTQEVGWYLVRREDKVERPRPVLLRKLVEVDHRAQRVQPQHPCKA
jgi:hypothetical protein